MDVDAKNRAEAVGKFKAMMTADAIKQHMTEKHPGEGVMSVAECHAMIEKQVVPAV